MSKGKGQFRYVNNHSTSKKPIKPTRLRNKDSEEDKNEVTVVMKVAGVIFYCLSIMCLIVACMVLGVF